MDISSAKLIFSEKCNQFYKPIRIDEDIGVVYLQVAKNRHNGITQSQIAHIEKFPKLTFIVMHNETITAEQHFLDVIENGNSIYAKMGEIDNFKKNMLIESERAMQTLKELSSTNNDDNVTKCARKMYMKLNHKQRIKDNRSTYIGQVIPAETQKIAWQKKLFIERNDDYCGKPKHVSDNNERVTTQGRYPCGFLIRDKGGIVVAGGRYEMSVQEVVDFVAEYKNVEDRHYRNLYLVPLTSIQKKHIKMCSKILDKESLYIKNENNSYFWVCDKDKNVVAGGEFGFNLNGLIRFCKKLQRRKRENTIENVTDKIQTSNSQLQISDR